MRKASLFILLLLSALVIPKTSSAQTLPDSIIKKYNAAPNSTTKLLCLAGYLYPLRMDSDQLNKKGTEMRRYFEDQKDELGMILCDYIATVPLMKKKDFANILRYQIPILNKFIELRDTEMILNSYYNIAGTYESSHNFKVSVSYIHKLNTIYKSRKNKKDIADAYNWLSSVFARDFMPDSGLYYANKAVALAKELKSDTILIISLSDIAENYIADKKYEIALPYLRQTVEMGKRGLLRPNTWAYVYNDYAQAFLGLHQYDSLNYYAHLSIPLSISIDDREQTLRAYEYLYTGFDERKMADSSNKYFRLASVIKDSLYSMEKIREVEAVGFSEKIHQQELENEKVKIVQEAEKQRQRIITISIVSVLVLLLVFLVFAIRTIRVTRKQKGIIEEKQKEIIDSIHYAKRIQTALLTSEKYIDRNLNKLSKD